MRVYTLSSTVSSTINVSAASAKMSLDIVYPINVERYKVNFSVFFVADDFTYRNPQPKLGVFFLVYFDILSRGRGSSPTRSSTLELTAVRDISAYDPRSE